MHEFRIEGIVLSPGLKGDPTDLLLDSLDNSGAIDAVASFSRATGFVSAMFTLDAEDAAEASTRGSAMFLDALEAAGLPRRLSRLCVGDPRVDATLEAFESEVSAADIARETGLSRERIRQLAARLDFPTTVGFQGRSPLYKRREVVEFFKTRDTTTPVLMEGTRPWATDVPPTVGVPTTVFLAMVRRLVDEDVSVRTRAGSRSVELIWSDAEHSVLPAVPRLMSRKSAISVFEKHLRLAD